MSWSRRTLFSSIAIVGAGLAILTIALAESRTSAARPSPTATATQDLGLLRAAATDVARTVQGTLEAQQADLATRVAAQPKVTDLATPSRAAARPDVPGPAGPSRATTTPEADRVGTAPPSASPTDVPTDPALPSTFRFYRGINFSGAAEVIEGRLWLSDVQARTQGLTTPGATSVVDSDDPLTPPVEAPTRRMLQSAIYAAAPDPLVAIQAVPNGTYAVYIYLVENLQDRYRTLDVAVEGSTVYVGWQAPRGGWGKLGPYVVTVSDGALHVEITATTGDPLMSGLLTFRDDGANRPASAP
jgi:hypothetical protein